ncbi:response regulator [Bacteroidota bacterium]
MRAQINILVVDDEQIVLDSIKKHLRNDDDIMTYTALDVENAFKIIEKYNINIVLTDLMMPEIDGLEFLKLLQEKKQHIIAIMITGYATINSALQAQQLGAFDYLAKPFTREELKKVVKRAVNLAYASKDLDDRGTGIDVNRNDKDKLTGRLKGIGEHSWFMKEDDGTVLIGVERPFLYSIGKIQNVYLPGVGDELRQGSVYFQVFSSDLRSESLLSPLSGYVAAVNEELLKNPDEYLEDPYGKGWLIKISPTNFDEEIKILGL